MLGKLKCFAHLQLAIKLHLTLNVFANLQNVEVISNVTFEAEPYTEDVKEDLEEADVDFCPTFIMDLDFKLTRQRGWKKKQDKNEMKLKPEEMR